MKKLGLSQKLTLGAMICALTLLCLYAVTILPVGRIALYFLSSVFIYALTCERAYLSALTSFMATSALAFLLLPEKTSFYAYVGLLGHYGIFKIVIDSHVSDRFLRFLIKLLYCNIFTLP